MRFFDTLARNVRRRKPPRRTAKQALTRLCEIGIPVAEVLDVGVFHGTKPLMEVFSGLHHHLFEPETAHFEQIRLNYRSIPHTLHEVAASDVDDTSFLESRSIDNGEAVTHSHVSVSGQPIKLVKLDTVAAHLNGPFILKIDVDGHEMSVLRGAVEILKRTNIVMIEAPIHGSMPPIIERSMFLLNHGFRITDIVDNMYYDSILWQVDLIFVHERFVDEFIQLSPFDYSRGFDFRQSLIT